MRIFQNIHLYPGHVDRIDAVAGKDAGFQQRVDTLIAEGLNGTHLLDPVSRKSPDSFLTSTADIAMQKAWARENGISPTLSPHHILLAQIEAFKPDVLYTQGPGYFPNDVRKELAELVKIRMCWKAPPDFSTANGGFQTALNNFPDSFQKYNAMGLEAGYFSPSFDSAMEGLCDNQERPIDIAFVGGYSRHHRRRAETLEQIARLSERYTVRMALAFDRATRLANTPIGIIPPLSRYRAPRIVRDVAVEPLFGRQMYQLFSRSKIVINAAIDVAGHDRGNIRCFEALGCGALMLSDRGRYPDGMVDGETLVTYDSIDQVPSLIDALLANDANREKIAAAGLELMKTRYSKAALWLKFQSLAAAAEFPHL